MSADGVGQSGEKSVLQTEAETSVHIGAQEAVRSPAQETPTEGGHGPRQSQRAVQTNLQLFTAHLRSEADAQFDVLIVHCYTGDYPLEAFGSSLSYRHSRSRSRGTSWLDETEMLLSLAPEGRVITAGYDLRAPNLNAGLDFDMMAEQLLAAISACRTTAEVKERPLVLVGHGLGGTIIQQAIATAQDPQETQLGAVIGIIFVATPLDGSTALVNYLDRAMKLPHTSAKLDVLNDKSTKLKTIYQSFLTAVAPQSIRYRRVHFVERVSRRQQRHIRDQLVLRRSEGVGSPEIGLSEPPVMILQSFENSLGFDSPEDEAFHLLCHVVEEFADTHFLITSAAKGHAGFEKLKAMLSRNVNVNLKDRWGTTALHEAVSRKRPESVQLLLLRGGADVNVADSEGRTPLHLAVIQQDRNIIDLLLRNGAEVNALDSSKQSPLGMSKTSKYAGPHDEIKYLLQYRPLVEGPRTALSDDRSFRTRAPEAEVAEACKETATVAGEVYFFGDREQYLPVRSSVWDLLYDSRPGWGPLAIIDEHRPEHLSKPICRWYHLPANNMAWVEDMFKRLRVSATIWGTQHGRQYRGPPHSRNIVSECVALDSHDGTKAILAMFLPFVSYERNTRLDCFRDLQRNRRLEKGRGNRMGVLGGTSDGTETASAATTPPRSRRSTRRSSTSSGSGSSDTSSSSSSGSEEEYARSFGSDQLDQSETRILQYYLDHEPPLHTRRTLDQAHYYMLKDTRHRDVDQVATRWAAKHGHGDLHNVLMVDQLWVWIIRDKSGSSPDVVVSSFPNRKGFESGNEDDLMLNVLSRQRRHRHPIRTSLDLVSQISTTCCNIFDRRQDRQMLQFLNFYESAIGSAVNKEAQLFDRFAELARALERLSTRHRRYHQIKTNLLNDLFRIHEEVTLLREVKDIRDEIEIISSILTTQQKVMQSLSGDSFKGWRVYTQDTVDVETESHKQVIQSINTAILDFSTMKRHAESAEASLNHLLDLKNKEANLHEAHTSNERSEEAVRQGQTVLIFTMVTIVFLPLSFMSSFFALGVTSFPHSEDGNLAWSLHEVSGWIFGMTFALAVPLLIGTFAISSGRLRTFYHGRILPALIRFTARLLSNRWVVLLALLLGQRDQLRRWMLHLNRVIDELCGVDPSQKSPQRRFRGAREMAPSSRDYSDGSYYTSNSDSSYQWTSISPMPLREVYRDTARRFFRSNRRRQGRSSGYYYPSRSRSRSRSSSRHVESRLSRLERLKFWFWRLGSKLHRTDDIVVVEYDPRGRSRNDVADAMAEEV